MKLTEYLQHLYNYNYWANHRILYAAERLTEEQLHQQQGHSWGSIHATLLHMMNAEWIWLQRWKGESPRVFPSLADYPTLAALRERWRELEAEVRTFVADQTQQSLLEVITYTSTVGETFSMALWKMLVHVPNHNTHHRGELAAMFASLDAPHPEEDWLHYFLEMSGQRE
jgi:uncharacterized damage-inducible protein DinB